ncbi:MAG: aminodeoxychorismate synthase component I [Candidatus Omnitrophica bacterium]|nr:aminodeoxychorismate synthase component I [Candidatus Omnitrophota bacterium]
MTCKSFAIELPWLWSPEEWFASVRGEHRPFLFESGLEHPQTGRWSFVGCNPFLTFESRGDEILIEKEGRRDEVRGDPVCVLSNYLARYHAMKVPAGLPTAGGAFGFFSYDLGRRFERLPALAVDDLGVPDIALGFYDEVVLFDHCRKKVYLGVTVFDSSSPRGEREDILERARVWTERKKELRPGSFRILGSPKALVTAEEFKKGVRRALDYIAQGDIFQVNLSQRFEAPYEGDPFSLYMALKKINPSPFGGFLDWGDVVLASASPERLVSWDGERAKTRPIAGTYPRGRDAAQAVANREALILDPKERAEHLMLVDLERNDLGRVSEFGTVHVSELMALEEYSHVIHIVSQVEARTRPGTGPLDLVRALFPGGTITGTPKIRAMEIIEEIEPVRRGVYTGSMGYLSFSGGMDLNIIIRTFVLKGGRAFIQTGAGIVADSDPDREYLETMHKGRALFEALERSREPAAVI